METLAGAFDLTTVMQSRGVDLASLGAAYLVFLATLLVAAAAFIAARAYLVVAPNRSARDYGVYVAAVLTTLVVASVLENELVPEQTPALLYVGAPQLLVLLAIHVWIAYRQEPWLIELGASAVGASVVVTGVAAGASGGCRVAHAAVLLVLTGLLVFLWRRAVSTKRAFVNASSIYLRSKENLDEAVAPQKPWLGLAQWVALIGASVLLALLNSMLRGAGLAQIPAVEIVVESGLLILVTAVVCGVPALSYWLARKTWMPDLTRFVWLVWIVVGFAFTYGNYLTRLARA
jgi:hypothetical protein